VLVAAPPVINGSTWYSDGSNSTSGGVGTAVSVFGVGAFANVPYRMVLAAPGCGVVVAVLNPVLRYATTSGYLGRTVGTVPAGVPAGTYTACFKNASGSPTATGPVAFNAT